MENIISIFISADQLIVGIVTGLKKEV